MKQFTLNFIKTMGRFAVEIYLVIYVLLNIMDFLDLLSGEIEFFKKVLSWIIVIHLISGISLSEILFGYRRRSYDWLMILSFSMLSVQSFVSYLLDASHILNPVLLQLTSYLTSNAIQVVNQTTYAGFVMLIILALISSLRFNFSEKSVLGVLHEEGPPSKKVFKFLLRFILTFIVLNACAIFVFKLLLEWFGWAVDAPLLIIGLTYWVALTVKHYLLTGRHFTFSMFIEHVGTFGEGFVRQFVNLFHYQRTFYIGLVGLFVLHILTDVFSFMIPYLTGTTHSYYERLLMLENHSPLFFGDSLLKSDLIQLTVWYDAIIVVLGYLFNAIAILLFMLLPIYFWYCIYRRKSIRITRKLIILFALTSVFFVLCPTFNVKPILPDDAGKTMFMGVDIQTQSLIEAENSIIDSLSLSIAVALVVLFLLKFQRLRVFFQKFLMIIITITYGIYIAFYFLSVSRFALEEISFIVVNKIYMLAPILFTYYFLTLILYFAGFIMFVYYVLMPKSYLRN